MFEMSWGLVKFYLQLELTNHLKAIIIIFVTICGCGGMADAPDLGSGVYDVGVQVPSSAPKGQVFQNIGMLGFFIIAFLNKIKRHSNKKINDSSK